MINNTYISDRDDLPETYEQALKFMDRVFWRCLQYGINHGGIITKACSELVRVYKSEEYVSTYIPR